MGRPQLYLWSGLGGRFGYVTGVGKHVKNMGAQFRVNPAWDVRLLLARGQPAWDGGPGDETNSIVRLPLNRGQLDFTWTVLDWPHLDRWLGESGWVYCPNEKYVPVRGHRYAVTVHDIYAYDNGRSPQAPAAVLRRNRFLRMLQRANVILVVSNFTKTRLVDRFRIDEAKIAVVGNGVEEEYFRAFCTDPLSCRGGIPQPYVLFVGGLRKKKGAADILRFAQALERLDASVVVVVVGPTDPEFRGSAGACRNLRILDRGFPDEQMVRLVRGASVAVSLSSYEGFGIPLVEAMAAGVPVVAANRSALPEVVGDAGFLVDPADSTAIAALVRGLINDDGIRAEYIARGRKRADGYRWSACAARAACAMQADDRVHSI